MGDARPVITGIDALDKLLFGDEHDAHGAVDDRSRGFAPGDVVLIRGEPGTGKTTLALQIAEHLYRTERDSVIRYVALEEALQGDNRRSGYAFCTDTFMKHVQWLGRREIEAMIEETLKHELPEPIGLGTELPATMVTEYLLAFATPKEKLAVAHAASAAINSALKQIFNWFVRKFSPEEGLPGYPRLFVIDSLGALMSVLTKAFPTEKPRLLFNEFCRFLREDAAMGETKFSGRAEGKEPGAEGAISPIILIIGEHHFSGADADRYFPESFFCDVEIVLRPEPIRVPKDSTATDKIALGYHLAAVIEADAQHVETRSFCRVVKSRYSRNQSRRCAYDIESGRGIRFYETFPGDGKLMLFAENEQQRSAWGSFFKRDLIDSYPALRYELFTMAGMETVYESSRRLLQVPLRTDMFLSSLDSYWVLGYRDYHMKTRINEALRERMTRDWRETLGVPKGQHRSLASTWICRLYPRFINELVHFSMCSMEKAIRETTRAELLLHPSPARSGRQHTTAKRIKQLDKSIDALTAEIEASKTRLVDRYDWLCLEIFGKSVDTFLTTDILPRNDLRETFLRPLPRSRMALFGQYNADLLPFLAREDMHQYYGGEDHWLCVPYDANIGIFVARFDVLEKLQTIPDLNERYREAYGRLKATERDVLQAAHDRADLLAFAGEGGDTQAIRKALDERIAECDAAIAAGAGDLPLDLKALLRERLTWDQVICLSAAAQQPFGLETRSFDTLMATFLEMIWNCGGRLEVDGRYKIRNINDSIVPLIRALHYFKALFSIVETPSDQTIDPALFHDQPGGRREYGQWLFARYWYSALMDALTATKDRTDVAPVADEKMRLRTFVWKGDGTDIGDPSAQADKSHGRPRIEILQMPRGISGLQRHFTCSGEWSFALLAGSENVALACDLISNLMGSLKVTERGRHGAGLPTVNQFYKRHESEPCIPKTIRADMELPTMTFGVLGECYLGVSMGKAQGGKAGENKDEARDNSTDRGEAENSEPHATGIFRQSIFDYRHCAREIFGELVKLTESKRPERDSEQIVGACVNMLRGIDDLGGRYIFIREPFRTDVATIAVQDFDGREHWSMKRAREPRLHVDGERSGGINGQTLTLENLSPGGCCFKQHVEPTSSTVNISIGSFRSPGHFVQGTDRKTHIAFDKPLSYKKFGDLLKALSRDENRVPAPRAPS